MMARRAESEHWSRVADLKPRLRPDIRATRQVHHHELWHVVEDPLSNRFFRLSDGAYRFVARLDGRTTVDEAATACAGEHPETAPTQDEVIQLLAGLHGEGLLTGDVPADAAAIFRRRRKRVLGERRSLLMNFLFMRIPLLNPEPLVDRLLPVTGWIFTPVGGLVWLALILAGGVTVLMHGAALVREADALLSLANAPLLLATFVLIKVCHEFGHAIACRRLCGSVSEDGRREGGHVHRMGVMLLVLMPVPYVDASSAWRSGRRWRRIVVAAAGMWVELGLAALAAFVWVRTSESSAIHAAAFSAIFIASVSTLLFNLNPLMRFDGYYILSDVLGMPNLAQRSREYVQYVVKRFAWGVRDAVSPARSDGEVRAFSIYGPASFVYRAVLYGSIILVLADRVPVIGLGAAGLALLLWVAVPAWKLFTTLTGGVELDGVRGRAILTTVVMVAVPLVLLSAVPLPDRVTIEGVIEAAEVEDVRAPFDGFVTLLHREGHADRGEVLVLLTNDALRTELDRLQVERARMEAAYRGALGEDPAAAAVHADRIATLGVSIAWLEDQLARASLEAERPGTWRPAPDGARAGQFVLRGEALGVLASEGRGMVIRAVAGQNVAMSLMSEASSSVTVAAQGAPERRAAAEVERFLPVARDGLPDARLARPAGGETAMRDTERSLEQFFEVRLATNSDLFAPGQRVLVRFSRPDRPLLGQAARGLRQLLRRRDIL
ncbi:MAG: hypothetical protein KDA21_12820 [Phycisphaerales bacterium]|nr:hypothetical protein [Phycisphaerales bacterium]